MIVSQAIKKIKFTKYTNPNLILCIMSDRVFTISTGRSGTAWLAEFFSANLKPDVKADIYHEGELYLEFGTFRPDIQIMHEYNIKGNTEKVRNFWKNKFELDKYHDGRPAVETSHVNAKAGLIENLDLLKEHDITIIHLKRDPLATALSLMKRYDFLKSDNMWIWYLDPGYKQNVVESESFSKMGYLAEIAWYICEMRNRAQILYNNVIKDNCRYIEVDLETIIKKKGAKEFVQHFDFLKKEEVVLSNPVNKSGNRNISKPVKKRMKAIIDKLDEGGFLP